MKVKASYIGETTDIFRRVGQHFSGLTNRKQDSVLYQHNLRYHPHQDLDKENFHLEVTRQHGTAISRKAEEGARIMLELANRNRMSSSSPTVRREGERYEAVIVMNSKQEFHQPLRGIRTCTKYLE